MLALVIAWGHLEVAGVLTVSAHDDCQNAGNTDGSPWTCGYTQLNNGNWPAGSATPQCASSCWAWNRPNGGPGDVPADFSGIQNGGQVAWYDDLIAAMDDWGGQPYNSPWMYEATNCTCSQVHDGWKTEDANTCGITYINSVDSAGNILDVTIMYNSSQRWWDGPPSATGCNAKSTAYHEEGHVFGLGHSSVSGDVMYWGGGNVDSVTGNSQSGLDAIYGAYNGGNSSGGGQACSNCQTVCGSSEDPCQPGPGIPANLEGYLAKAWDLSQGIPASNPLPYAQQVAGGAPNPVTIISPQWCLPYYSASDYQHWAQCVVVYLENKVPPVQ